VEVAGAEDTLKRASRVICTECTAPAALGSEAVELVGQQVLAGGGASSRFSRNSARVPRRPGKPARESSGASRLPLTLQNREPLLALSNQVSQESCIARPGRSRGCPRDDGYVKGRLQATREPGEAAPVRVVAEADQARKGTPGSPRDLPWPNPQMCASMSWTSHPSRSARAHQRRLRGGNWRPFRGVAVALKDCIIEARPA